MSYLTNALIGLLFISAIQQFVFPHLETPTKKSSANQSPKTNFFTKFYQKMGNQPTEATSLFLQSEISDNRFNVDTTDTTEIGTDGYIPIMTLDYFGTWYATQNLPQFNFLTQSSGFAHFTAEENNTDGVDDSVIFWFFDGPYIDQRATIVNFVYDNDTDFNPINSTFKNDSIVFTTYYYDDFDSVNIQNCSGSYQLSFINVDTNNPYNMTNDTYNQIGANFWLNSSNCSVGVNMSVAFYIPGRDSKAMDYSIMVTLICVAHLYACIQLIKQIMQNESEGTRISLMGVSYLTCWDIYLCLFHLYSALTTNDFFHYFITPAFWYFILGSIFETRLMIIIWKTQYYSNYTNMSDVRRAVTTFYLKFYGFLTLFLFLCYYFIPATWFFYLTSPIFVPQIYSNAKRGGKAKFNKIYIFLLGFVRILIPLYAKGCPVSIFKLTPSNTFIIVYTSIILGQILIIYLQSKIGSRFFVPAFLLPPKFNYYVKIAPQSANTTEEEQETCSICMDALANEPGAQNNKTPLIDKKKQIKIMQTPCRHRFHESCLKSWMDIKLECPFCRNKLPPLE